MKLSIPWKRVLSFEWFLLFLLDLDLDLCLELDLDLWRRPRICWSRLKSLIAPRWWSGYFTSRVLRFLLQKSKWNYFTFVGIQKLLGPILIQTWPPLHPSQVDNFEIAGLGPCGHSSCWIPYKLSISNLKVKKYSCEVSLGKCSKVNKILNN